MFFTNTIEELPLKALSCSHRNFSFLLDFLFLQIVVTKLRHVLLQLVFAILLRSSIVDRVTLRTEDAHNIN